MWRVEEHRRIGKRPASMPIEIQKRYEKWLDIVGISGPPGLIAIRGFHDEALSGQWQGFHSSRLNLQYRVIYKIESSERLVQVFEVAAHDYRRR